MRPLAEPQIQAVIIGGAASRSCDGYCGLDWSAASTLRQARQQIKARFQEKARLRYVSLSNVPAGLREKISKPGLSLPLLLINGETRIAGEFDLRMLLDAIEGELEIKRQV